MGVHTHARRGRIMVRFLGLALALITVAGCSWNRSRINVKNFHTKVAGVQAGQTTAEELQRMLGTAPNNILRVGNGKEIHVYSFGDGKSHGFNVLIVAIGKTNMGLDTGVFMINANGVVERFSVSNNSQDLSWEWWAFGE